MDAPIHPNGDIWWYGAHTTVSARGDTESTGGDGTSRAQSADVQRARTSGQTPIDYTRRPRQPLVVRSQIRVGTYRVNRRRGL